MLHQYLWYFIIYAVLGWMTEVAFSAVTKGKIINRGFLNGPVCPIYGFGMLLVIICLTPLKESRLLLYLGSCLITTVIEGLTGFILEKIYHQRWWDYTREPFNLGGYVCLRFSLIWGLACVFVLKFVHIPISVFVAHLPQRVEPFMLAVIYAVFFADCAATVRTLTKLNAQLGEIDRIAGNLRALSDDMSEHISERTFVAMDMSADVQQRAGLLLDEIEKSCVDTRADVLLHIDELRENARRHREVFATLHEVISGEIALSRLEAIERRHERISELIIVQQEALERTYFGVNRLLNAFENVRSTAHSEAMSALRRRHK